MALKDYHMPDVTVLPSVKNFSSSVTAISLLHLKGAILRWLAGNEIEHRVFDCFLFGVDARQRLLVVLEWSVIPCVAGTWLRDFYENYLRVRKTA